MESLRSGGLAIVIGATGGIGEAMVEALQQTGAFAKVTAFSRASEPDIDLIDEQTIIRAAAAVRETGHDLRLVFDATGFLHGCGFKPEKTLSAITPAHMAHAFAVNAMGPALLMKHFLPLLAKDGKSVFATLSAKVGSIGDNALGGWYSYRASKAALNQFVHSAAIELARKRPEALCVALHPGTVDTGLSSGFAKNGLMVRTPGETAGLLLGVLDQLIPSQSGGFFDYRGEALPW
ncbi:MAG: SDR family oxidoreductase [Hoeflea sp.]|uniref:SDR family oxidoreductase n=1 Tax=Hoeflea sp. TaxID=1940281 RepID=UPI001D77B3FD|nr:SDR family NAD(P)-dependent oxidoreductase [Hoeflea sp.]MBU4527324.1 SDR family oxidoreductase [Alphaproteobacteria bacterium]MBU4546893.1 SDR family oxidoreductase [Alphaproteobacteria bacterium]MBU4551595.1 SDR family oxidoreductase [Alphaproteobacteria bacterium]MBV1725600.1 SDR family oxidoreductase [Hoeflea sp.]MBV1759648.1 SDR family oxidoreductase [Hoeflea sp.]